MPKIGSYEYPLIHFSTIIKAIEILVDKFEGKVNNEETYAIALGHKSNKSGGFFTKLADMRRYGLIGSRGIESTERAKVIVKPLRAEERNIAINDALMEIKLWEILRKRIGVDYPSSEEFKIHLAEVTGDRDSSINDAEKISNLYKDAMSFYTETSEKKVSKNRFDKDIREDQFNDTGEITVPESLILIKSGDVNISLPRTDPNIDIICNILKGLKQKKEK